MTAITLPPPPEPDWILEVRQWLQDRDNAHAAAVSADFAAENARLREALKKIAKSNPDEDGCYYTNRRNIGIASRTLKGASHE